MTTYDYQAQNAMGTVVATFDNASQSQPCGEASQAKYSVNNAEPSGATCPNCKGERWVCEDHSTAPWGGDQECCGGAGMPCPLCNRCDQNTPPAMPPDTTTIWDIRRGFLQ